MALTDITLEMCASTARVLARRREFFSKKPGDWENIKKLNKEKLGPKVYQVFSDNKHFNQETTQLVASPNRRALLRKVQRAEAVNGAITILGRGEALNEFINVINGRQPWLTLNQDQLMRIVPDFNFEHFKNFANIANNLKVYDGMLKRNISLNSTQKAYVKEQLNTIKLSSNALSALMDNERVVQLTNYYKKEKEQIAATLKAIGKMNEPTTVGEVRQAIKNIQHMHEVLGFVFDAELLKPKGVAFMRRRALASLATNRSSATMVQPQSTASTIQTFNEQTESAHFQNQRESPRSPTARGEIKSRSRPRKPSAAYVRKHNPAQVSLFSQ